MLMIVLLFCRNY